MQLLRRPWRACWAFPALAAGCASVNPTADYRRVDDFVQSATGARWTERPEDAAALRGLVDARMAGGISAAEALEICLINNPRVRAAYLTVGVARADLVQAGLFQNPSMSLALRMPDGGGLTNLQTSVAQNIADFWLIPARVRAAEGRLQSQVLDVARTVSAAALDTRAAYYAVLAADREVEILAENRGLAQQLVDAALARRTAGAGSEIDVNLARTELMQTEVLLKNAGLVAFETRRRLTELLGLASSPESIVLSDSLPTPPVLSVDEPSLLAAAEISRLDLVASGYAVAAAAARVEQEKLGVVSNVELGVSFERGERGRRGDRPLLADTLWASAEAGQLAMPSLQPREQLATDTVLGPTLTFELPIFDQNQAQIARAEILLQAAQADQAALLLDATLETRGALRRVRTAAELAGFYRDSFLPLAQTNLELSREAYRGGKLSLLAVLEAQKALLAARGRYVEALRDNAVAVTELERAVGLPVERLTALPAGAPASRPN